MVFRQGLHGEPDALIFEGDGAVVELGDEDETINFLVRQAVLRLRDKWEEIRTVPALLAYITGYERNQARLHTHLQQGPDWSKI